MPRHRPACRSVSPVVRDLFETIDSCGRTHDSICHEAGVFRSTFTNWRMGTTAPTICNLEAVCNVFGLKLKLVPMEDDDHEHN